MTTQSDPRPEALREALESELVPWFKVRGDDSLDQGILRRCLLCGRLGRIVSSTVSPDGLTHEPDCAFEAALRAALAAPSGLPDGDQFDKLTDALAAAEESGYRRGRKEALDEHDE